MDLTDKSRRRGSAPKAGSIWESRMKIDQVKGGFKVFTDDSPKTEMDVPKTNQTPVAKRKTWNSESSPVKIAVSRSESTDSINRTPISITLNKPTVDDENEGKSKVGVDERAKNCVDEKASKSRSAEEDSQETKPKIRSEEEDKQDFHQKVVIEEKILVRSNKKSELISPIVQKQPLPNQTNTNSDNYHRIQRTRGRLQSFVDVIMWRDASKSAFVFGTGTFAIISSSYTPDLNISFISLLSYLGLVYLAAIFLFRSLITRGSVEKDANEDCVIGEEEAIWVMKVVLPYINEFLLKLRALFSGDPATTKLALLLFILARCGSSITIWTMAKLGFIGIFTVPKVCSTYSSQLAAYGTFWMRRFGDVHKKAVGFALFALLWNLSSLVARIWAAFMVFVALKHYQQSSIKDKGQPINGDNSSWQGKQNKVF